MRDVNFFVSEKEDLVREAYGKGNIEYANKVLKELEDILVGEGRIELMAEIYEKFGQFSSAIELWEKVGNKGKVSELLEKRKESLEDVNKSFKEEKLLRRTSLFLGIFSFGISIFLFAQNMTGLIIIEGKQEIVNFWGIIFFIIALIFIFIFIYLKKKGRVLGR
ncbi:MAG: hypothetical protein OQK82_01795 [Candidatus Pacearchaeota archaeon]|nr:hypothetical protein [Candidatus Pacearchaeota archaeon]